MVSMSKLLSMMGGWSASPATGRYDEVIVSCDSDVGPRSQL